MKDNQMQQQLEIDSVEKKEKSSEQLQEKEKNASMQNLVQ